MLDSDLAMLYGVETREIVQAVKRNIGRFPDDFMFQLAVEEFELLKSQSVISKPVGRRSDFDGFDAVQTRSGAGRKRVWTNG